MTHLANSMISTHAAIAKNKASTRAIAAANRRLGPAVIACTLLSRPSIALEAPRWGLMSRYQTDFECQFRTNRLPFGNHVS